MKTALLAAILFSTALQVTHAQTPVLGTYPATTVLTAGDNTIVTPSVAPANTVSIVAYTTTRFKGTLHVNPATGALNVTNAQPAGTYTITIKAFNGAASSTTNCTVTVGGNVCSQGFLSNAANLVAGDGPNAVAIADFNSDGNHDLAVSNTTSGTISIRLGNGGGGFTGTSNIGMGMNTYAVAAADFNGDGKQDLVAGNAYGNLLYIRLGDGNGNFGVMSSFPVGGTNPYSIAIGDFNSDNKPDLAIAATGNAGFIAIRLGDGAGGFTNGPNAAIPGTPQRVTIGDFNNDGKTDLAASIAISGGNYGVAVRLGDGAGNFSGTGTVGIGTTYMQSVAVADMNGDGNQDLVTAEFNTSGYVYVSLGNGAGGFNYVASKYAGNSPLGLVVADFNGDGFQDAATANYYGNNISVILGNGTGGLGDVFTIPVTAFATTPASIAAGDFNEDGVMDVAVVSASNSGIVVLQGRMAEMDVRGNGSDITDGNTLPTTNDHTDFGNVSNRLTRTFTIRNTGDGNLTVKNITISGADSALFIRGGITLPTTVVPGTSATFTVRFTPLNQGLKNATVKILNDDCDESVYDFAIQGNAIAVVPVLGAYNATTGIRAGGNRVVAPSAAPLNAVGIIATTTTNFKGKLTIDSLTGAVKIINAHPAGAYTVEVKAFNGFSSAAASFSLVVANPDCSNPGNAINSTVTGQIGTMKVADLNSDGRQDLAFINGSNTIQIKYGNDSTNFTSSQTLNVAAGSYAIDVADVNGDGRPDILATSYFNQLVTVLAATPSGGFTQVSTVPVGTNPTDIAIADFNKDGKPDFAACSYTGNTVSVRLGDLNGAFTGNTEVVVGPSPQSIFIADFNNDGNTDFAVTCYGSSNVYIRLGNGSGGFTNAPDALLPSEAYQISITDINADGKPDLVTANRYTSNISIRLGNGAGGFSGTTNLAVGETIKWIATADFNGDGKQDIIATHGTKISYRFGDGTGNFTTATTIAGQPDPWILATGDFNNDGKQDLAIRCTPSSGPAYISVRPGSENDANVKGNNANILDGSTVPAPGNHTDFGTGNNTTRTYTIQNTGPANLNVVKISITGADSAMFTLGSITLPLSIPAGSSDTFRVTFSPISAGQRTAIVNVFSDDCDEPVYDFSIQGTGVSAVGGSYPSVMIANAGGNALIAPAAAPQNYTNITAKASANFKGVLQVDSATGRIRIINAHPEGNYTVTVGTYSNQLITTNSFSLRVNAPACSQSLFTSNNISLGTFYPNLVAIGDFNNDLKQDFALGSTGSNNVSIRMGDGAGGLAAASTLVDMGVVPSAIAVSDFNGDGKLDFATTCSNEALVRIRLGDGTGSFTVAPNVPIGNFSKSITIGDFNGDGKSDFATANYINPGSVSIRFGNGNGSFTGINNIAFTPSVTAITSGDFNNDGITDLAVTNSGNSVTIFSGNGTGNFTATTTVAVGSAPVAIVTSDFNSDGFQDFATANQNSSDVSVRLNNGSGEFTAVNTVSAASYPLSIAVADFNGDGKQDLITTGYTGSNAIIRLGDGLGTFNEFRNLPMQNSPYGVVVGDFNSDGRQDIAVANSGSATLSVRLADVNDINVKGNNVSIPGGSTTPLPADHTDFGNVAGSLIRIFTIQNTGPVNLIVQAISLTGSDSAAFYKYGLTLPATIAPGDSLKFRIGFIPQSLGAKTATIAINSDDCDEAIYRFTIQGTGVSSAPTLGTYPTISIASAGGNAIINPTAPPTNASNITAATTANFKGVLQVDSLTGAIVITNAHPAGTYTITVKVNGLTSVSTSFTVTVGNTKCSQALFSSTTNLSTALGYPSTVLIADMNNDGKQDLIYNSSSYVSVRLGDGLGGFANAINIMSANHLIAAGDFNGDGKQDVAVGNNPFRKISVYLGNGTGNLIKADEFAGGSSVGNIATADFNSDGKLDMLVANPTGNTVSLYLGNGAGGFTFISQTAVGTNPGNLVIADYNNDGFKDFAVAAQGSNSVSVRLGTGTGSFTGNYEEPAANPLWVSTGDLNGDGNADILITNYLNNTGTVALRFGNGAGGFTGTANFTTNGYGYANPGGDLNGDGKQDIVFTNNSSAVVTTQLGDGTGNFTAGPSISAESNAAPVAIADLNNDGRQDLVIPGFSSGNLYIRLGNANEINIKGNNTDIPDGNTAASATNFTDFENVSSNLVRTFTIQNTGQVPLTISNINFSGGDFSSFVAGGINLPAPIAAGSFTTFTINFVPASAGLKTTTVNIFNNDCDEALYDFAIQGNGIAVTPALGNYPATIIATAGGNAVINPSAAPINAVQISAYTPAGFKGVLQVNPVTGAVTVTNAQPAGIYNITVRANGIISTTTSFTLTVDNTGCSQGLFSGTSNTNISNYNFAIAVGDFNGDGRQDFASANYLNNSVSIGLGDGTGNFNAATSVGTGPYPRSIAISDFNSDGRQDFVTANYNGNTVSVRLGNGAGGFTGTVNLPVGAGPQAVAISDFNGDGKPDFATANYNANNVTVYFGDGAGSFYGRQEVTVGANPGSLTVNDFNGDGNSDLAVTNYTSNTVSMRLGDGLGGFTTMPDIVTGTNPISITTNDFNGDGNQDLAIANYGNGLNSTTASIRLGNGAGSFTPVADVDFGGVPLSFTTGDFNGDGKADLATTLAGTNVAIRLGNGTGSFTPVASVVVGESPRGIVIGDFNGDGRQDFATANNSASNITVRLNSDREINLIGNGNNIPDGSAAPTAANLTDFGTVPAGSSLVRTYTIQNTGTSNLIISGITVSSADSALFAAGGISLPLTIAARSSTTFTLTFTPTGNGVKTTRLNIASNDCDESVYDFTVRGTASCSPSSTINTWLGTTTDWNLASNWSLNFVPSECTKVVVNAGVPFMPEITSLNSACYSLTLNNGATITIKSGGHLNITANN